MKAASLFILLVSNSILYSQTLKSSLDLGTKAYFIGKTYRLIGSSKVNLYKGKHSFGIGMSYLISSKITPSSSKSPKLIGAQAIYHYYPNGTNNRFNLFLFEEISAFKTTNRWSSTMWNRTKALYEINKNLNEEFLFISNIGYGIQFNLSSSVSLYQTVSIGFYHSISHNEKSSPSTPYCYTSNNNISGYNPSGFTYGFDVGIKIRICSNINLVR